MLNHGSTHSAIILPPRLGLIIRFKDSAATLPAVLAGLRAQTVQPDLLLGVDNRSQDGSSELMRAAGAKILCWDEPYHHARVLNFALHHCPTELVMILSSHTVLRSPDVIARLLRSMEDQRTACASGKWDDDPYYSDSLNWPELKAKGLKFGSIYSNSMGMFRRCLWETSPFEEALPTLEDGAWAVEQVKRGYTCRRLPFDFSYRRQGSARHFVFALITFQLAKRHGLKVAWLGVIPTLRRLAGRGSRVFTLLEDVEGLWPRLAASLVWRFYSVRNE